MSIIIKKEDGKFNMYQNGTLTHENLKVIVDKRKGDGVTDGDIKLPENSYGKQWLSTTKFTNGITEIDLFNVPSRSTTNTNGTKTSVSGWFDYLTDEEKKIYEDIKLKATERMNQEKLKNQLKELAKNLTKEELMTILGMNGEG